MKRIYFIIFFYLFFGNKYVVGQIAERNFSFKNQKIETDIPIIVLPDVDVKKLEKEDRKFELTRLKSMRFAKIIQVDIDPEYEGVWKQGLKGEKSWYLKIKSPGAYSLSILFNHYRLPIGSELLVYSADLKDVHGAFTYKNNKSNSILAIAPVKGDEIVIEYHEPANVSFKGELHISSVAHDYKNVIDILAKSVTSFGGSGSCNVNINCDNDEMWQKLKHSVCKITFNGWLCSGALINNTKNDGTPYFLTANHCIDSDFDASAAIFYFNYESPNCLNIDGPIDQTISGSEIIASPSVKSLDFTLLKLSSEPPANYNPYFAGWSRDVVDPESVTSIHHPWGDIKKITKSYDGATTSNYGEGFTEYSHWWIDEWNEGTTEGGSSGSPLFNQNGRIVGDLTGGDASCSYNYNDYYQQFHRSWNEYTNPTEQLKKWLDPINRGLITLDGYLPYDSVPSQLKATIIDTLIHLTWNKLINFNNVKRYIIYRDSIKIDSTINSFYTDSLVYKDSVYSYRITARLISPSNKETFPSNIIYIRRMNALNVPFMENFEGGNLIPNGWYEERSDKNVGWEFQKGGITGVTDNAYEGSANAFFYEENGETSKLVLPKFDFTGSTKLLLSFYLNMPKFNNITGELKVFIKKADTLDWEVVRTFTSDVPNWELEKISLSDLSANYQIAFGGIGLGGGGICLDSICINVDTKFVEPDITTNKGSMCNDDSVEYSTSIDNTHNLEWDFGESASPRFASGKGPHKVKYLSSGIKGAELLVDKTYIKNINDLVYVYSVPNPDFIVKGNALISNYNYGNQWFFNGKIIVGATDQNYIFDTEGYYSVEVTNSTNCSGISAEKYVMFNGIDDSDELKNPVNQINIYPNPNNGVFTLVQTDELSKTINQFKIIDIDGKVVQSGILELNKDSHIRLENVNDGIYLLILYSNNKKYSSKILIKK